MNVRMSAWKDFRDNPEYSGASNFQIFQAGYRAAWEYQAKKIALYTAYLDDKISQGQLDAEIEKLNALQQG